MRFLFLPFNSPCPPLSDWLRVSSAGAVLFVGEQVRKTVDYILSVRIHGLISRFFVHWKRRAASSALIRCRLPPARPFNLPPSLQSPDRALSMPHAPLLTSSLCFQGRKNPQNRTNVAVVEAHAACKAALAAEAKITAASKCPSSIRCLASAIHLCGGNTSPNIQSDDQTTQETGARLLAESHASLALCAFPQPSDYAAPAHAMRRLDAKVCGSPCWGACQSIHSVGDIH